LISQLRDVDAYAITKKHLQSWRDIEANWPSRVMQPHGEIYKNHCLSSTGTTPEVGSQTSCALRGTFDRLGASSRDLG
jgi:hypothetical protein